MLFDIINKYINEPHKVLLHKIEKAVMDIYGKGLDKNYAKRIIRQLTSEKVATLETAKGNINEVITALIGSYEIPLAQSRLLEKYYVDFYADKLEKISNQLVRDLNNRIDIAIKNNRAFDRKFFEKSLTGLSEKDIIARTDAYVKVFGNQYRNLYEQKLRAGVLRGEVDIFLKKDKDGITRHFFKYKDSGKEYNLDSYLDGMAKYEVDDAMRNTVKVEGEVKGLDLVRFIRVRTPKFAPRDSHEAIEGNIYSLSGNSEEYESVKVLEQLPENDEIYINGNDWNFPYNCGHMFEYIGGENE
jgi:hypothetical protein